MGGRKTDTLGILAVATSGLYACADGSWLPQGFISTAAGIRRTVRLQIYLA